MSAWLCLLLLAVICVGGRAYDPGQERHDYSHRFISPKPGPCPKLGPVQDFNMEKFLGRWHQLFASDRVHWNTSMHCVQREYKHVAESNRVDVVKYYITHGHPVWENANWLLVDGQPGSFQHGFPKNESSSAQQFFHRVQFHIVDTDYDSYLALWGCYHDEKSDQHFESGGISSRTTSLPESRIASIVQNFRANGCSIDFEPVPHQDCRATCA